MTNNTHNTLNNLITETFTSINDEVFCTLIDADVEPGTAYGIAYIDIPASAEVIQENFVVTFDDLQLGHDDVVFADR